MLREIRNSCFWRKSNQSWFFLLCKPQRSRCLCDVCNRTLRNNRPGAGSWSCCSRSLALATYWSQLMSVQRCEPVPSSELLSHAMPLFSPTSPRLIFAHSVHVAAVAAAATQIKDISQDPSPMSGHPWATSHRPGCWADSVGLFPKEQCCFGLLHKCTSLCHS